MTAHPAPSRAPTTALPSEITDAVNDVVHAVSSGTPMAYTRARAALDEVIGRYVERIDAREQTLIDAATETLAAFDADKDGPWPSGWDVIWRKARSLESLRDAIAAARSTPRPPSR